GMDTKSQESPVPDERKAAGAEARAKLMEEASTGDEQLMEKFLTSGDLTHDEIRHGLCERVVLGDLLPVFCCSAYNNHGVKEVLDEVVDIRPPPWCSRCSRNSTSAISRCCASTRDACSRGVSS